MLRYGENTLSFPSETPVVDLSPLNEIKPKPGTYWAIMDPPRHRTAGGLLLRVSGDGWNDRNTELVELAEQQYREKEREALERIAIYRKDQRSKKNFTLAQMAAEVAMAAHDRWQMMSEPEAPGAGLEERPDSYTIAKVGAGVPFTPGDRVLIAPYAARRFQELNGVADVVVVGKEDPWEDVTILLKNPLTGVWEPLSNWVAVKLSEKPSLGLKRKFYNHGTVLMAGPDAESCEGDLVALHRDRIIHRPDNSKWFATWHGPWDRQGVLLVREVDSDGVMRVLGTIETCQTDTP